MEKIKQQFGRLMGSGDRKQDISDKVTKEVLLRRQHLNLELSDEKEPEVRRKSLEEKHISHRSIEKHKGFGAGIILVYSKN